MPDAPLLHGFQYSDVGCSARTASQPPAADRAKGIAITKPTIFTVSCTTFTYADAISPPAVKYSVISMPPSTHPAALGMPTTTFRIQAIAINCPARMKTDPNQSSPAIVVRTATP